MSVRWQAFVLIAACLVAGCLSATSNENTPSNPSGNPSELAKSSARIFVDSPPSYATAETQSALLQATDSAIQAWQATGRDVLRTYNQGTANIEIQFIKEWGNGNLGQDHGTVSTGGLVQIGIGDSVNCDNVWTPYDYATLVHVIEHELGHAFGYQHSSNPNDLMYPSYPQTYGDWCQIVAGTMSPAAGGYSGEAFTTPAQERIRYTVNERENGAVTPCVMTKSDWDALSNGGPYRGYGCQSKVASTTQAVAIPAGQYVFASRCENYFDTCQVDYSLAYSAH